jgi:hypothetical protein
MSGGEYTTAGTATLSGVRFPPLGAKPVVKPS